MRHRWPDAFLWYYNDAIMGTIASHITSLTIVYSAVYSGANQRKRQSSAPLAFVRGIHRWPVNSPHKGPVTRKMFPFDDIIMNTLVTSGRSSSHPPHLTSVTQFLCNHLEAVYAEMQLDSLIVRIHNISTFEIHMYSGLNKNCWQMLCHIFYHDVEEICWPRPISLLKLGHVTGQGPDVGGTGVWPGKNNFHKRCNNFVNIAVYLIAS